MSGKREPDSSSGADEINVRHEASAKRFAVRLDNKIGYLSYEQPEEGVLDYAHVYVPPAYRERGIAAEITRTALDYARREGYSVIPSCPYVEHFLGEHPEYEDVVNRRP